MPFQQNLSLSFPHLLPEWQRRLVRGRAQCPTKNGEPSSAAHNNPCVAYFIIQVAIVAYTQVYVYYTRTQYTHICADMHKRIEIPKQVSLVQCLPWISRLLCMCTDGDGAPVGHVIIRRHSRRRSEHVMSAYVHRWPEMSMSAFWCWCYSRYYSEKSESFRQRKLCEGVKERMALVY